MKAIACLALLLAVLPFRAAAQTNPPAGFRELFNGKDLTGWVDVNTSKETWTVRDGLLVCTGKPIGVMRSEKQYENFILHIEWRHMQAGGNSGVAHPRPPRGPVRRGVQAPAARSSTDRRPR